MADVDPRRRAADRAAIAPSHRHRRRRPARPGRRPGRRPAPHWPPHPRNGARSGRPRSAGRPALADQVDQRVTQAQGPGRARAHRADVILAGGPRHRDFTDRAHHRARGRARLLSRGAPAPDRAVRLSPQPPDELRRLAGVPARTAAGWLRTCPASGARARAAISATRSTIRSAFLEAFLDTRRRGRDGRAGRPRVGRRGRTRLRPAPPGAGRRAGRSSTPVPLLDGLRLAPASPGTRCAPGIGELLMGSVTRRRLGRALRGRGRGPRRVER